MRTHHDIIGEHAVYPGHPIVLAYIITHVFETYEAATAPSIDRWTGQPFGWCEAVGSSTVPGAGGNVHAAVDLLAAVHKGKTLDEAFAQADRMWRHCDDMGEKRPDRFYEGQAQADRIKPLLRERLSVWLSPPKA